ncbi:MAG: tRNA-dihydrouridine synthase [Halovenus sp.]
MSDPTPAFEPSVALASLSGASDAAWARAGAPYVGLAFLGGIAVDDRTRDAARALIERDRSEFLPPDPVAFIDDQLAALADAPVRPGFNVRTTTLDPLERAASVCASHGAVLEINAHCRQEEMCTAGAGERLLHETDRLCEQVETATAAGATVSVKVRAEVDGVDLVETAARVGAAGAVFVHVDAMDTEGIIEPVTRATEAAVIANNGVRDRATVEEYLEYGATAVSVGRPSDNPAVLERVRDAASNWFRRERQPARLGERG